MKVPQGLDCGALYAMGMQRDPGVLVSMNTWVIHVVRPAHHVHYFLGETVDNVQSSVGNWRESVKVVNGGFAGEKSWVEFGKHFLHGSFCPYPETLRSFSRGSLSLWACASRDSFSRIG